MPKASLPKKPKAVLTYFEIFLLRKSSKKLKIDKRLQYGSEEEWSESESSSSSDSDLSDLEERDMEALRRYFLKVG